MTPVELALIGFVLGVWWLMPNLIAIHRVARHDRALRQRPDYGKIARLEEELFGDRFIDTRRELKKLRD